MPVEITMPQLSDTMTEGTLIKWHKKEGEPVREGEVLAEIETDKANMDLEAFEAGTVAHLAAQEGQKVKVGELLAVLAATGETPQDVKKQFAGQARTGQAPSPAPATSSSPARATPPSPSPGTPGEGRGEGSSPRRAPQRTPPAPPSGPGAQGASSHDVELGHGNIEEGRAQARRESVHDVPEHTSEAISREAAAVMDKRRAEAPPHAPVAVPPPPRPETDVRLHASPLARRMAAGLGVDLARVEGSGPGGRIVQRDILEHAEKATVAPEKAPAEAAKKPSAPPVNLAPRIAPGQTEIVTLSKMRSVIATRLQQSKQTIPHFYETVDVDMESLATLRTRLNKSLEEQGIRLSLNDFIAKALSVALKSHPALNATFDGAKITRHGDVNLGMAVALPEGLIVPVLRSIDRMGLREIRARSADLIERARALRLRQEEMSGATFTITNLGTYGVREFAAIINPPEVAILAIASAEKRAVVRGDQIVARTIMTLTLSADHRCVDGATGAEFLRTLKQLLEEPGMMLV